VTRSGVAPQYSSSANQHFGQWLWSRYSWPRRRPGHDWPTAHLAGGWSAV